MIEGLLWLIGLYGSGMIAIHLIYNLRTKIQCTTRLKQHFILVTINNQRQVEWYIRYIFFMTWWRGKNVHLTIVDKGSHDDTMAIIRKLKSRYGDPLHCIQASMLPKYMQQREGKHVFIIHINQHHDLRRLLTHF
ncbi:hypothetical protein [Longirhabdus pacifica]|uniref:hypothetical protein n=1 Tax=Longirhabdus pacifica TaxID=2305227 RepID=UPI001008FA8F|nr:hypothetical protein [Longirhabdus pacifica]